jgi:hypothetical protein
MVAVSLAAIFAGLPLSAMAQQSNQPQNKKPAVQGQPNRVQGLPKQAPRGGPTPAAQIRGPGPRGQVHAAHAIGEHGYRFRGAGQGRRAVGTFSVRERAVWSGGHWRHERRFGRDGYWWEVNGVWYFYDQPLAGPPDYVSEVEFGDDGADPDAPVVVVAPPVIYVPPPPPVVCIGPLCVR